MTATGWASVDARWQWRTRIRLLSATAAILGGVIYLLIGLGVLDVGTSTTEPTTDLFAFGALMAGLSAVAALALMAFRSRLALGLVALATLVPLLGYFGVASYRDPAYEPWGIAIKVCQFAVFAGAAVLAIRARPTEGD